MQREIKFRAWAKIFKEMYSMEILKKEFALRDFEDDDFVWQQYTGLKDKNSVEIYEGDIISFTTELYIDGVYVEREYVEFVTYEYGAFCLDGLLLGDLSDIDEEIQVIGNIYENPELLEVK